MWFRILVSGFRAKTVGMQEKMEASIGLGFRT